MPAYSFLCSNKKCKHSKAALEIFSTISNYKEEKTCPKCGQNTLYRDYQADLPSGAVKKGDNEITVGHLAHRNTERMSEDQKESIWIKQHEYMEKPLSYAENKKFAESRKLRKEIQQKLGLKKERSKKVKNDNKKRNK